MTVEEVKGFSRPPCVIVKADTKERGPTNADRMCVAVWCHSVTGTCTVLTHWLKIKSGVAACGPETTAQCSTGD